ncbi:bifunctional 4-hydroxy-3-methylbut-2-enyl diphosphate reductase/30S ribosomal protein S1 [Alkalibaculum sp. M08DMB]|uniref:4-hydroxy-3-methylbut-2-enyl diphosphate reductase n=1 Tax=Alkalibaculum sporogenes TaxID=2655001 RepID=A0A6A7K6W7_9FIRM|nr:bifunctional 4-hydroxy-3-methylbut-2-enyl diphosphate reductase/30S ribosomal protein S1 [Alkalibaculum sporogenes]MPW25208.1 bifunctional 4-hydroxy-3-methylbut-2-enyl diphosphate reductase/30S ribosomal protein S1 [Alkalibaculum sporogenes]
MELIIAKTAGYCFGVNNAVDSVEKAIKEHENTDIYTLGPIIHNKQVIDKLTKKGVKTIEDLSEISQGIVIIRSHGVGENILKEADEKDLNTINATCPYVKSIQQKVNQYYKNGYKIIIIGDKNHPEVKGINGWCENNALVVDNKNSVPNTDKYDKICVVAQTTITNTLYKEITDKISEQNPNAVLFNTICNATRERQDETKTIASSVDCMIIIGGYHSSNTQKLVVISQQNCKNTIHIETKEDLEIGSIRKYKKVGISAGASTPRWIIEEVIDFMENNLENEIENDMKESYEETFNNLKKGSVVEGKVISASDDEIIVNVGYKTDGIIKKHEFTNNPDADLSTLVKPQDVIEVLVLNIGQDNIELSKIRIEERKAKDELEKAYQEERVMSGRIVKVIKGGLMVDIDFSEVFMPASQYHFKYIKDLNTLMGEEVRGKIIEFDKKKNKVIFSQRVILEEEQNIKREEDAKQKNEFFDSLKVGQKIDGKVKSIMKYGVFIEIGPIDGFVHISDLSYSKVKHPSDIVKEGEIVETVIINLDHENAKIKLSIKELTEDPWTTFIKSYSKDTVVQVKITNILSFGAFAEIIPQVEGLIHISEISHDKVENVESVLTSGEVVEAKIINIDKEKKKISLSIKETLEPQVKEIEENVTVYKEDDASPTLGDLFGDLFK